MPDLLAFVVNMLFGVYVYRQNRQALQNKVFAILMLSVCVWQFGEFNLMMSGEPVTALFWDRFLYVGLILAPTMTFVLALVFPTQRDFIKSPFKVFILFVPSLFLLSLLPTNLFISGIQEEYWGFGKVVGPFFWLFRIHLTVFILLSIATFLGSYKMAETGRERIQSKYLLSAISFPGIIGVAILIIFQPLGLKHLNTSVASLASIVGTIILSYAIVKHRLMDVDLVLQKGTIYGISILSVVFPSLSIIILFEYLFFGESNLAFSIFAILTLSASCIAFSRIKHRTEKTVEKKIFRDKYVYKSILKNLSKEIVTIIDLDLLCSKVIHRITSSMKINSGSIFVYDEEKGKYELQEEREPKKPGQSRERFSFVSRNEGMIAWLEKNQRIFVKDEWEKRRKSSTAKALIELMKTLEAEVLIPLILKGKLLGFISLGEKRGKNIYSIEDLDLLETLANQTAIAIENAKLYEDLKRQKAVMRRADRLASLGTLTAGLAHEIRNPLVAIKTLTQLLPERLDDEEFRRDFLKIASGEVDRISSLVNELLEFARPTEPQLKAENIEEIMEGMILLISTETKKKSLDVITSYQDHLPLIPVDREQIKQVFLNALLNAVEATDEGGRVCVEIRTFSRENGEEFLQVEIRDTGRGIPEEHLENVFTPFFTTKDKGSGLGLSISHQIIREHGGTIGVESRLGEGSSFFINFPVSQFEKPASIAREDGVHQPF